MTRARRGPVAGAALLAAASLAWGCATSQPRSVLDAAGPAARRLENLGWPVLVGFLVTSAVMWLLLVWVARRRTGSLAEHAPIEARGGGRWLLVGGLAIPAIAFAEAYFATVYTMGTFPMGHEPEGPAQIRVVGRQWWWEVHYRIGGLTERFVTANEIHVPAGRPIDVELESRDVIHSFWVPRLHGKVDLIPGLVNRIRIQADRPGTYEGACAEFCGPQHARMRFVVIADSPEDFRRWLEHQREPAPAPATAAALRGRRLFEGAACATCHTVRGTDAKGTVGPDLTHLASRRTIAGASLTRDVATLHAWVANAQSLKPGARMPNVTQFTGGELGDVVTFLEGLE